MERMFSLLYEAAHEGNVVTLRELLQQDRLILDRLIFINNNNNFSETPLHVAAMLDHVDFVKEIIIRKPELAKELDMWGSSPLHVASAKGHLKTIKVLLSNNIDHEVLCYAWDREGRNPLHLAAMRGKIDVLRELLRVAPKAGQVNLAGRSENILHVCVKYNQFEVLKFMVNVMDDYHFLNAKDDYGMNILHLAVALKQIEIIKYLVTNTRIEVNDVNANKFTALDILAQSQRSEKDFDISECLRSVGASRTIDPPLPTHRPNQVINNIKVHHVNRKEKFQEEKVRKPENWLTRKRESLMVVASLIATMAFQAGTNPPGGLWQDDNSSTPVSNVTIADSPSNNHFAGESIMGYYKNKTFLYHSYLYSNTVGFVGSLSIILLLVTGLPFCRKFFMWILTVILWVTITAMTITYVIAICVVAPNNNMNIVVRVVLILIISWGGVMIVIALLHTIRLAIILFKWLLNVFMARRKKFILTNWDSSM
ncbi:ankyrin repeat-containing protein BDA1-like [Cannabis sativa]|uniref:ankyrin repeat-containing protein BDA1-like n=1 Tax=Cannabis sativa TaxID=3483 RepID=UPI0029CA0719|nr:ankyrin repeat-containing protein BDA1-like [Cannabis sativa]